MQNDGNGKFEEQTGSRGIGEVAQVEVEKRAAEIAAAGGHEVGAADITAARLEILGRGNDEPSEASKPDTSA